MKKILIFFAIILGCTLLGFFVAGLFLLTTGDLSNIYVNGVFKDLNLTPNKLKVILMINHLSIFILSAIILAKIFENKSFKNYAGFKLNVDLSLLSLFILMLLSIYPSVGLFSYLASQFEFPSLIKDLDLRNKNSIELLLNMQNPLNLIFNVIVIGIIPGIGEEMLFRGVIQHEFSKVMKRNYLPIILTSLIFSFLHFDPSGFIPKFLIGCCLGYAYFITKNIFYPIILHTLNNSIQVILIYLSGGKINESNEEFENIFPILIFSILSWLFTYYLFRKTKNYKSHGSSA